MTTELKAARAAAKAHGHKLSAWLGWWPFGYYAECERCGRAVRLVTVDWRELPRGARGKALEEDCE